MNPEQLASLLLRYRGRGVLLDANVLIPYLVGLYDSTWFDTNRHLQAFKRGHGVLLRWIVDQVGGFVTTTPVLTEVTNRLDDKRFLTWLERRLDALEELQRPARLIARQAPGAFVLGLADASVIAFSGQYLPVTSDRKLLGALDRAKLEHLRFDLLWAEVTAEMLELQSE